MDIMMDYTSDYNDKGSFIKNFRVHNGELISKLASGAKHRIPHTKENEEKVLGIMRKQVKNIDQIETDVETRFRLRAVATSALVAASSAAAALVPWQNYLTRNQFDGIALATIAGTICLSANTLKFFRTLNDVKKTRFFLENEDLINTKIKENPNIITGISRSKVRKINQAEKNSEPALNINNIDIDNWSLQDLQRIKENILREQEFAFDYSGYETKRAKREKTKKDKPAKSR